MYPPSSRYPRSFKFPTFWSHSTTLFFVQDRSYFQESSKLLLTLLGSCTATFEHRGHVPGVVQVYAQLGASLHLAQQKRAIDESSIDRDSLLFAQAVGPQKTCASRRTSTRVQIPCHDVDRCRPGQTQHFGHPDRGWVNPV
jgi:hypothetical protein